jgi:hypothetical protein
MNKNIITAPILIIFALSLIVFFLASKPNNFTGKFKWQKFHIPENLAPGHTNSEVYESIENMKKIFDLEVSDECHYLAGDEWTWKDRKDPASSLVPIFCWNKGGGWAMLQIEN